MSKKPISSAEAAANYAAKDYFISQRTEQLTNAFNAGVAWLYSNQWHDIYVEAPPKSGQYLVIYLMDNGGKLVQVYDILVYFKEEEEDGRLPWGLAEEYEYLAGAITHWAYIPKAPAIEDNGNTLILGRNPKNVYYPEVHRRDYNNLAKDNEK
ncbi:hypothetical protein [Lepagella muris]|jgi:hypothetical protein|uniref:Uncharacterized protein n=1 Tax=Lepagella muris TaxID=3032870 RepID=A0AC61RME0_9BACT|nr:hypothetical protein [Lepagella muris]ROS84861.1 hypothetical protein EEL39_16080 [Muribaculaceae bacterium Isolate-080 (Janvier)]ROT06775.1 hypothetical protein EEL33_08375 [Muribaculaceae bacterium Isolate-037 (Harlan)]THG53959.1 hypothetical protein E5984_00445 [Bacteroidales bacterium]TGY80881.1 hypothetical protein E5331_00445 [Lepagella muris]TKC57388.1 hypothetical protein E5359_012030 [Bacteroidales bacterium]